MRQAFRQALFFFSAGPFYQKKLAVLYFAVTLPSVVPPLYCPFS